MLLAVAGATKEFDELLAGIQRGHVILSSNVTVEGTILINQEVVIDGGNHALVRRDPAKGEDSWSAWLRDWWTHLLEVQSELDFHHYTVTTSNVYDDDPHDDDWPYYDDDGKQEEEEEEEDTSAFDDGFYRDDDDDTFRTLDVLEESDDKAPMFVVVYGGVLTLRNVVMSGQLWKTHAMPNLELGILSSAHSPRDGAEPLMVARGGGRVILQGGIFEEAYGTEATILAVYGGASVTATGALFRRNWGAEGPISVQDGGDAEFVGCVFSQNAALWDGIGGAIVATAASSVVIDRCYFDENTAWIGGALFVGTDSAVKIRNSTFMGGLAAVGGAIDAYRGATIIAQGTHFVANEASPLPDGDIARGGAVSLADGASFLAVNSLFLDNDVQGSLGSAVFADSGATFFAIDTDFIPNDSPAVVVADDTVIVDVVVVPTADDDDDDDDDERPTTATTTTTTVSEDDETSNLEGFATGDGFIASKANDVLLENLERRSDDQLNNDDELNFDDILIYQDRGHPWGFGAFFVFVAFGLAVALCAAKFCSSLSTTSSSRPRGASPRNPIEEPYAQDAQLREKLMTIQV